MLAGGVRALPADVVFCLLAGLWLLGTLYWCAGALDSKKIAYRQPRYQLLAYAAAVTGGILVISMVPQLQKQVVPYSLIQQFAGIGLCTGGVAFAVWARAVLGRNWSATVALKEGHELIQRGPYRIVRHPIYTGLLGAIAGTLLALKPSFASIAYMAIATACIVVKLKHEEKLLMGLFPVEYAAYKRKVKGSLIPFVL